MGAPTELDRIAYIALSLFGNGALQISGNIGDKKMALKMLDAAREAIASQLDRELVRILVPGRDVEVVPSPGYPLIPHGDVLPELRPYIPPEGVKP